MKTTLRACALAAVAATLLPASAIAAPVTVNLRVEGPDSTLFEGPVTTDVRQFSFAEDHPDAAFDERTPLTCDANGDSATVPSPSVGAALMAAREQGLTMMGQYFSFGGPPAPFVKGFGSVPESWNFSLVLNWRGADFGACGQVIADGDQVLFAYRDNGQPLLKLTVPNRVAPGATATATVTDGETGAPVAGATVDGRTTAADGTAQIGPFSSTGARALKATKDGYIRSNAGALCVTSGSDGACGTVNPLAGCVSFGEDGRCGTADGMPPTVRLSGITSTTYTRATAPRELKGVAGNFKADGTLLNDPSGIKAVRLRITRYNAGKCWTYNGTAERFQRLRSCGTGKGQFFTAATSATWSYLLPAALKPGKYRVEAYAIDGLGNADRVRRWNRNHVVFRVK